MKVRHDNDEDILNILKQISKCHWCQEHAWKILYWKCKPFRWRI